MYKLFTKRNQDDVNVCFYRDKGSIYRISVAIDWEAYPPYEDYSVPYKVLGTYCATKNMEEYSPSYDDRFDYEDGDSIPKDVYIYYAWMDGYDRFKRLTVWDDDIMIPGRSRDNFVVVYSTNKLINESFGTDESKCEEVMESCIKELNLYIEGYNYYYKIEELFSTGWKEKETIFGLIEEDAEVVRDIAIRDGLSEDAKELTEEEMEKIESEFSNQEKRFIFS